MVARGADGRAGGDVISLVLFDVNGVLYRYDKPARLAALARLSGLGPEAIDQAIWASGFEDAGDAGELGAKDYLRGFGARLSYPLTEQAYVAALAAALSPIPPMLALARRVGERTRLAVLTNNNLLVRAHMDALYPGLGAIFGAAICASAEQRARKPAPEAYRRCLARLGESPARCLFIDDSADNIAGAAEAGLHTHHYTDEAGLVVRLGALRVL
jgi:putative hydrolase of the HAD superfamily